jgi:Recombinase
MAILQDCAPRSLSLGRVPWLRSALTRSVEVGASYLGVGAVERMREARKAQAAQFAANILPIVRDIQAAGHNSLNAVAGQLNARNVPTAYGGQWRHVQVRQIMERASRQPPAQ